MAEGPLGPEADQAITGFGHSTNRRAWRRRLFPRACLEPSGSNLRTRSPETRSTSHVLPGMQEEAANKVEAALRKAMEQRPAKLA